MRGRRGGRRRLRTGTCSCQPPRSLSFSAAAFRGNLRPAEIPAPPLISPKRRQARDSGEKVAGARGFTRILPWCRRERSEPGSGGGGGGARGRRRRRTKAGLVPPTGASRARVPPLRPASGATPAETQGKHPGPRQGLAVPPRSSPALLVRTPRSLSLQGYLSLRPRTLLP
ncbi:xylosyltransferase 1-like [Ailuropoda melanoleuca]|uniref:xylosyltransferase 1-like n=1 Tax=Ailuropoda melanoleuca TaxID=9646 RepID=UPI0014941EBA|nr:xylosyltransferase 1-like [Ailuropoda melanoleuca]